MIRFAVYDDIPALKHIRKVCFDEDEAYSAFYCANRFTENNTLVYVEQQTPVASLTLLMAEVATAERIFPIAYVYAVATLPEQRCRGLAAALLQYADEYLQSRGVEAALLVPASALLFDYYAKLGYETTFFIEKHQPAFPDEAADAVVQATNLNADDYFRLRKAAYAAGGYFVQWDRTALDYALQECRLTGGMAYHLHTNVAEGFFLAYPAPDNTVIIKESWLNGNLYPLAFRMLQTVFGKQRQYIFYRPQAPNSTTTLPFGMMKYYTNAALPAARNIPYFGLAKD